MISGILSNILIIGFILCFFSGCIYLIIDGIQKYLKETDGFYLFGIIVGCVGIIVITIPILKAFGL